MEPQGAGQMSLRNDSRRSRRVREQAVCWYMELQNPNLSARKLKRWQSWIAVPEHRQAFDEAEKLWQLLGQARPQRPTDAEVAADTYDGSESIADYEQRQRRAECSRRRAPVPLWMRLGLAAVVLIGVGVVFSVFGPDTHRSSTPFAVFETAAAEHESVVLADGSQIELGARTAVTSNEGPDVRFFVMDRGEAMFLVVHDPKRPFRVLAGGGVITAVGTTFNVRRLDNRVVVTVSQGTVEVAPATAVTPTAMNSRDGRDFPRGTRVSAGHEISYDAQGKMSDVRKVDVSRTTSWREGLLQYESEPLTQVVQDINRYSHKTVTIADASAAEELFTGTVFERDIDDWLAALPGAFEGRIEVTQPDSGHVVIRSTDD